MINILERINDHIRSRNILAAFWSAFWLLNGLDKFFNHEFFFGVTRDEKFIGYFARLNLSPELALTSLYIFAVVEVILGLAFLSILLNKNIPQVINRLTFKGSMLLFFAFSIGDILFGDRMELWEHGTFMIMTIISFEFYLFAVRSSEEAVEAVKNRFRQGTEIVPTVKRQLS
jgi:hypothetical protein